MADQQASGTPLDEIEKVAEALEARDFHFAASCAKKVLEALAPAPVEQTDEAFSTSGWAEAHKAIKALDAKEFSLVGVCLRKAIKAYSAGPQFSSLQVHDASGLRSSMSEVAHSLAENEFSTAADYIRRAARFTNLAGAPRAPLNLQLDIIQPSVETEALESSAEEHEADPGPMRVLELVAKPKVRSEVALSESNAVWEMRRLVGRLESDWEALTQELAETKAELARLRGQA